MISELYAVLTGSTVYSSLEITSGYHTSLSSEVQMNTDFVTPIGKFELKDVPFGLTHAPGHFQLLIDEVLKGFPFTFGYLGDIFIFSTNAEEHLKDLGTVLCTLNTDDQKLKRKKCDFFKH